MSTLYRKYRPQTFAEAFGQSHIKLTLEQEIKTNKVAHAYLFCGPRAVGKTTLARILTKALNCTNRKEHEAEPCNECASCLDITSGRSLDVLEMDAASQTGVDNVRENIIAATRLAPSKEKYKVFIIDEVHMLSTSSFNALLKTLEEPPAYVVFILCTTEINKVPSTIISRCQRFDFKRISIGDQVKKLEYIARLEKIQVEKNILEEIARHSGGHMRDAESIFGQIISAGGKEITWETAGLVIPRSDLSEAAKLIACLVQKDPAGGIGLVNNLIDNGVDLKTFLIDTIEMLRKMLIFKINPMLAEKISIEFGESLEEKITKIGEGTTAENLAAMIERLNRAKNELSSSNIIQLPVELAIVELTSSLNLTPAANNFNFSKPTPTAPATFKPSFVPAAKANPVAPAAPTKSEAPTVIASPAIVSDTNIPAVISLEQILAKWVEFLARVKTYNHSLSFVINSCRPFKVQGNVLTLVFKYKLHRDRLNDKNIKVTAEQAFTEVYGVPVIFMAEIDENLNLDNNNYVTKVGEMPPATAVSPAPTPEAGSSEPTTAGGGANMLENILKNFGGKVVS